MTIGLTARFQPTFPFSLRSAFRPRKTVWQVGVISAKKHKNRSLIRTYGFYRGNQTMAIDRRSFLVESAGFACSIGLSGCAGFVIPIPPTCANDPTITDPSTPLTIDVHAHVFNGSDLQVNAFLQHILRIPGIGPILQEVGWGTAPTGMAELAQLQKVRQALGDCKADLFLSLLEHDRENQYQLGYTELNRAADQVARRPTLQSAATADAIRQIRNLPRSYTQYRERRQIRAFQRNITLPSAIDFILRNFQYRYVNVFDYLHEYSLGRERKIDLIIAHLVDFDWGIGGGLETYTSIPDQILVMEQICALTAGRVHCFVPFDPLKQVAFELGGFRYSPLETVSQAILSHGFVGVKLYPPMGFQPYGNALKPSKFWMRDWIPALLRRPDLGRRLDDAMALLYEWCLQYDVPIMGHTAPSNGPIGEFKTLSDPGWWELAIKNFPGLRINFGHFGDPDKVNRVDRARRFAALMDDRGPGQRVYADSAYFVDALTQPKKFSLRLRSLLKATAAKGRATLAQRLMYGTDWEMIIIEGRRIAAYLKDFEKIFAEFDKDPSLGSLGRLSNRFFGINAANYLGLHQGSSNRGRVDAFYSRMGVVGIQWLAKVDNLPAKIAQA